MDPVTILSLISATVSVGKVLFQGGESLYKFIEGVGNVDQSIRALHRETAGLGQTIAAIREALEQPAIKDHQAITQDYSLVWRTLDTSMHDCEGTAKLMKLKFKAAQPTNTSFLSQAWGRYKLSIKEGEIKDLRSQIHIHGSRLQLSLQMIVVIASITSPDRVIESINPRLDHLISMVQNQPLPQSSSPSHGDPIEAQISQRLNQEFQRAAEVVVTSASTIVGNSRSTVAGLSLYGGRTGSELGTPLDAAQKDHIHSWIPQPDTIEEDVLSTTSKSRTASAVFSPAIGSALSSVTDSDNTGKPISSLQDSTSTFGNLELETIRRLRVRGLDALKSGDFINSKSLLEQTITRMKKLPPRKQKLDQLGQCEILLAYALQEIQMDPGNWDWATLSPQITDVENSDISRKRDAALETSEKLLAGALTNHSTTETYKLIATYGMCLALYYQYRHEEAYNLCHKTVSSLRVQGLNAIFQSKNRRDALTPFLKLLSAICKSRGDDGEAAVYDDIWKELGGRKIMGRNAGSRGNSSPFNYNMGTAIERQKQAMMDLDPRYRA